MSAFSPVMTRMPSPLSDSGRKSRLSCRSLYASVSVGSARYDRPEKRGIAVEMSANDEKG